MEPTKKEIPWLEVLAHAKKLSQLVGEPSARGVFSLPPPAANQHILGMFWRARRLYDGVLILLEAELPEEAAILSRSLFEVSLHLQQLEAEPDNRYALVFGWINRSINEQFGLLKECEPGTSIDEAFSKLENQRGENSKNAAEHGVKRFLSFLDTKTAARKFGRGSDILIYQWTHESVHGSEAVWMFARQVLTPDTVGLYARTGNPTVLFHFAYFAARSMAAAAKATFTILGWTLPPEVEQSVSDIERLFGSAE